VLCRAKNAANAVLQALNNDVNRMFEHVIDALSAAARLACHGDPGGSVPREVEETLQKFSHAVAHAYSTLTQEGHVPVDAQAKLSALHDTQREALRRFEGPVAHFVKVSGFRREIAPKARTTQVADRTEERMVGRDGIEPPTPGFSVLCSTN
jgi:hypothetical protein